MSNIENNVIISSPTFQQALYFWLKLGFISFGGPAGQIAIMHHELVEKRHWISEAHFLHALNFCMILPGPEAQQLATYIGWLFHGVRGGIISGLFFILPSLIILIGLSWIYLYFGDHSLVNSIFYGIKSAVVAIIAHAAYRMGKRVLKTIFTGLISVISFISIFYGHLPFPFIISFAAIIGFTVGKLYPHILKVSTVSANKAETLNQTDFKQIPYIKYNRRRLIITLFIGLNLWLIPMLILILTQGWSGLLTQMSWFMTKAALLTLGGAYAVLPYIYQGVIEQYHWLTAHHLIDGLALGETTPGPLIMLVAFVGFVANYLHTIGNDNTLLIAGIYGAIVATWFTFLPSFIFIFVGAPLIEKTHQQLKFTNIFTTITAAIVGIIIHLWLSFSYQVYYPKGWSYPIDIQLLKISVIIGLLLFVFNRHIIEVIMISILLGLITQFNLWITLLI